MLCNCSKKFSFKNNVDTTIILTIDDLTPQLWSPVNPNLYNLVVKKGQ